MVLTDLAGLTIALPPGYEYVLLSGMSTVFLTGWQASVVAKLRKKYKVHYPQLYAEKAQMETSPELFKYNCAQRAHLNTLESYPQLLFSLLVAGVRYPRFAASAGLGWTLGRLFYTLGYLKGPEYRFKRGGFLNGIASCSLMIGALCTTIGWAKARYKMSQ